MTWSFSRVNAYDTCPAMFKHLYIDEGEREGNAFAEWGTLMHSLFERYFKGALNVWDLSRVYEEEYGAAVSRSFPKSKVDLDELYYNSGKDYWDNFDGLFDDYKILSIEQRVETNIGERRLVGISDLILEKGGIHIVDHKSHKRWKSKKERQDYLRQLYLYSLFVKEKYGEWPSTLSFNLFQQPKVDVEPFNFAAFEEARDWFLRTIDQIYKDQAFWGNENTWFCSSLCDAREYCDDR